MLEPHKARDDGSSEEVYQAIVYMPTGGSFRTERELWVEPDMDFQQSRSRYSGGGQLQRMTV